VTILAASTFTDALGRLTSQEQKQVKIKTMDLMLDPRGNGLQLHKVEASPGFWTARVNQDIRLVLHKDGDQTLLAWVGHHDEAYRWAERRRLVQHERTGSMQFVPVIDGFETAHAFMSSVSYLSRPRGDMSLLDTPGLENLGADLPERYIEGIEGIEGVKPFADLSDDALLDVGVPRSWLEAVRATEETGAGELFDLLPAEAAEALLDYLTGGRLEDHIAPQAQPGADPFAHPDALRRFRVLDNVDELRAALDQPFEKWAVFLHPLQRDLVERDWKGPVRVSGSAGTGKTIVALHRAVHLAQADTAARVLLTTFSKPLAAALQRKLDVLTDPRPGLADRVAVRTLDQAAFALFTQQFGQPSLATDSQIQAIIRKARKAGMGGALSADFLFEEWREVVDAWHVTGADDYASVPRIGRRTRLGPVQRAAAWAVFTDVRQQLAARKLCTWSQIYARLGDWLEDGGTLPFSHVVVDEAQDLSVAQVRFLAKVAEARGNALFLAGDIGQRIFHLPFSWARLGLDIRGRSQCLKVNYRTSHQIRVAADRLLPSAIADLDGVVEGRRGTVSVFDGPDPELYLAADEAEECARVAQFIRTCLGQGVGVAEIGLLVRGPGQLPRARAAVREAGLDPREDIAIVTMHEAKGLEFRAVCIMACDEDVLP
jgi:hypothetical protein